jgi:uncharacterized protein
MEMKRTVFKIGLLILFFITCRPGMVYSQDFPDKPVPPRLVNDFAGLLSSGEANALERKLVEFNDSTSTQIAIAIVKDLNGYAVSDYAPRLGDKWGVGQKGKNNGVLIVIKPKTDSKGEVFIATGYGADGAVPDLACSQIVDNIILPAFRQGDYYGGLDKATSTIMALIKGEYTSSQFAKNVRKNPAKAAPVGIFIIIFIIIMIMRNSGRSNNSNISRSGLPFWLLLGMMNSGRNSHNGSWGGFSGGGGFGGGGGGGGGFGGFGGGGFGGGGAGGSW